MILPVLGIDIAKLKFDACLINIDAKLRYKVFPNNVAGFAQLAAWLTKQGVGQAHACMEATGTYGEALALHLHAAGHTVSIINPAAVKAFAGSRLSRTKTDKVDAELIARFCVAQQPPRWTPPAREVRELQALVRRLEALIRRHIDTHPDLRRQHDLLDSIPGIGETTAALLLAEIVDVTQYRSARQVAAYAGLVPRERRSGSSVRGRTRLSKVGNSRLRKALYFPAITALRCSPFFKAWAAGLRARGKCKMSVIGAAMRKLIHLAYGVLKTGKPFDPAWVQNAKSA